LTNSNYHSSSPRLSAYGSNVHLVYQQNIDPNTVIYYKRSTDGGTSWNNAILLTDNYHSCDKPDISVSGNNIHVVYLRFVIMIYLYFTGIPQMEEIRGVQKQT